MQEETMHLKLADVPHEERTYGQRAADALTKFVGSWTFIFLVLGYILVWIVLNLTAYIRHWDPWPFIILNLTLSCLAALHVSVILMSQRRTEERSNKRTEYDYQIDRKSFRKLENVESELRNMSKAISRIEARLNKKR